MFRQNHTSSPTCQKPHQSIRHACLSGALTALLYGVVEYTAVIMKPLQRWGPHAIGPEHWFWETLLLSIYVLAGIVIGAVVASRPNLDSLHAAPRVVVAAGVAVLLAGRLSTTGFAPAARILDVALVLLAYFVLRSAIAPSEATWPDWFTSPWIAIPLVAGFVQAAGLFGSALALAIALLGLAFAAILGAVLASLLLRSLLNHRFLPLTAAACVVLLGGAVSLTLRLNAPPPLPALKPAGPATKGPNVLLIVLDTVRADHLSLYGYARRTSPNLEALAREGVLYRNAIAAADMTLSSYGAMYTSLYPSWHGSLPNPANTVLPLDPSFVTLAKALTAGGYSSAAVLANHGYLNREFGMQQGFGHYDVRPPVASSGTGREYWLRNAIRPVLDLALPTAEMDRVYRRSDQITDSALRILASRTAESAPLFLSVNYMDAHEPYLPPAAYRDRFNARRNRAVSATGVMRAELAAHRRSPQTQAMLDYLTAQYDGSITYIDSEVQRLLNGLRQTGLYDNTLVIVTADHGEALGERDALGHPVSVHQELIHVPLLIKYPRMLGILPGQQDAIASGLDLMPTILDVAGIPIPDKLQGRSLLHPDGDSGRTVFSESFVDAHLARNHLRSDRGQRAVYQGPWKLISTVNGATELYNWSTDPLESHNLYTADNPVARQLGDALGLWLQAVPRRSTSSKKMDSQTMDRLRGLGYVK